MFRMHMKLLRETCALLPTTDLRRLAYLEEPHKKLKITVCETLCGQKIVKTPLWAVQHCLSRVCGMGKSYCIHTCEISELSTAADGVFVIFGHINPNCVSHESAKKMIFLMIQCTILLDQTCKKSNLLCCSYFP